jgi:hypothetical protein
MAVTLRKATGFVVVLTLACASACTCPQAGGSRNGRPLGGQQDPSGGSFAFFGSLRSFFSESPSEETGRKVTDADMTDASVTSSAPAAAPLTIR